MNFQLKNHTSEELVNIYRALKLPRLIEEKMLILLRQGKISKWFSAWGQEAISVGTTLAISQESYVLPMHRNLGVFTSRNVPLEKLFLQFLGKENGFTKGRDRSFHFGTQEYNIIGMISHLGAQMGVADGIALAQKLDGSGLPTVVFTGDGGASEGDFHEALNVAAVWDLPVVFVVENNAWGLSTPSKEQFRCTSFTDKGKGYGMEAMQCDGNNILEVMDTIDTATTYAVKKSKPILVEMMSFRMRGHEEASGTKYYPEGLQDEWSKKDPIDAFESALLKAGVLTQDQVGAIASELKDDIAEAVEASMNAPNIEPDISSELNDVFMPHETKDTSNAVCGEKQEMRFIDAVSMGLGQAMEQHPSLVLMGQDIAEYGGVFKVTEGFLEKFGKERVRNTPICESAIVGAALGLSIRGRKAMVEMQFSDFVSCGFNQIVNNLAKVHWRWGQNADVVIRMPTGGGVAAGPFHSQSTEAWFFHEPGLKIAYPAFPQDAKDLLLASFEDPNPVLFFEHKALYRSVKEDVFENRCSLPFGKARVVHEGQEAVIITYGLGVHWALEIVESEGLDVAVIDLRTLSPLDYDTIERWVQDTGKVLVLHEDNKTGGIGAEIAAEIGQRYFTYLDAPVMRCASLDTAVPFSAKLEEQYLAIARLKNALEELLGF